MQPERTHTLTMSKSHAGGHQKTFDIFTKDTQDETIHSSLVGYRIHEARMLCMSITKLLSTLKHF